MGSGESSIISACFPYSVCCICIVCGCIDCKTTVAALIYPLSEPMLLSEDQNCWKQGQEALLCLFWFFLTLIS